MLLHPRGMALHPSSPRPLIPTACVDNSRLVEAPSSLLQRAAAVRHGLIVRPRFLAHLEGTQCYMLPGIILPSQRALTVHQGRGGQTDLGWRQRARKPGRAVVVPEL